MKKRIIAVLMAAALCVSFSACSSSGGKTDETKKMDADKANASSETQAKETSAPETQAKSEDTSVSEQVLFDQDNIKITATELSDGMLGPEIKLLIENNSDKGITVQSRKSSINGFMTDFQISSDVAAGKKAADSLTILKSDLTKCNIDTLADIELSFHIFDSETWDTIIDSDIIQITTSLTGNYTQEFDTSGTTLYDENGVKIISQGIDKDISFMGPSIILYIENNSGQEITIQARDTSIDGFMVDPILSTELQPGKKAVSTLTIMSQDLESSNITEITNIELSFHIFNSNTWDTIIDTAPITATFE